MPSQQASIFDGGNQAAHQEENIGEGKSLGRSTPMTDLLWEDGANCIFENLKIRGRVLLYTFLPSLKISTSEAKNAP